MTELAARRPRRSALFVPASSPRAVDKARTLACDVVILDLEDLVAAEAKAAAREAAVAAVRAGGFGRREVVIRTNGQDTPWGAADLAAVAAAGADSVLIPKVSGAADLVAAREALGAATPLWAMIETPAAILRLSDIGEASAAAGVAVWAIGSNDLAKELGCPLTVDRPGLQASLSLSVVAARAYRLAILDGVFNEISDGAGLASQSAQALGLGFDGKTLIHPDQIETVNRAFTPAAERIAWAEAVVAAFEAPQNAGAAVVKVDGAMVEHPHLDEARRLIALADEIAATERPIG